MSRLGRRRQIEDMGREVGEALAQTVIDAIGDMMTDSLAEAVAAVVGERIERMVAEMREAGVPQSDVNVWLAGYRKGNNARLTQYTDLLRAPHCGPAN